MQRSYRQPVIGTKLKEDIKKDYYMAWEYIKGKQDWTIYSYELGFYCCKTTVQLRRPFIRLL